MSRVCTKCRETKSLKEFFYHRQRKHYMASCKACNSKTCLKYQQGRKAEQDSGFLIGSRAAEIRRRCKYSGVPVANDLRAILQEQWTQQQGLCYYSQIPLVFGTYAREPVTTATVDRIDPALGYIRGNVVFASARVNLSKQNMSLTEFRSFCSMMVEALDRLGH